MIPPRPTRPAGFLSALATGLALLVPAAHAAEPIAAPSDATAAAPANVILLTIDTLRPDHLGVYGYPKPTSPRLDAFAAEAVVFGDAVSSAAWTSPGLVSIFTGLFAPRHGVVGPAHSVRPGTPTIATELARLGYAVPNLAYLTTIPNYANLGFGAPDKVWMTEAEGGEIARWLASDPAEPFLLWYHHRFVHLPYDPSPEDLAPFLPEGTSGLPEPPSPGLRAVRSDVIVPRGSVRFAPEDPAFVRALYDGEIRRMDRWLGSVLDALAARGLLERSIVVLTADHGEDLFDQGWVGHSSTTLAGSLHEALIRIPLIVRFPGGRHGGTWVPTTARGVDVLPTVLDALGHAPPPEIDGRSLMPAVRGEPVDPPPAIVETVVAGYQTPPERLVEQQVAIRDDGWKLILERGRPAVRLHHFAVDPVEGKNLAGLGLPVEARLREQLTTWLARHAPGFFLTDAPTLGPLPAAPADAPCPQVESPADGAVLRYEDLRGIVTARWTGRPDLPYVLDYVIGEGPFHTVGSTPLRGHVHEFGPYPRDVWRSLVDFNPWAVTVRLVGRDDCPRAPVRFRFEVGPPAAP